MSGPRKSIHDGWTPQPQEQEQPRPGASEWLDWWDRGGYAEPDAAIEAVEHLRSALAPPEPTPGLREAIEKFVGTAYPNNGEGHTDKLTWTVPERAFGDLRRALAASPVPEPPDGFVRCPLCHEIERTEDIVGGVCLTCADGISFSQNARRGAIEVPNGSSD